MYAIRGGGDRLGKSDSDLARNSGDEVDGRAPEDADEYEGHDGHNDANAHVEVVFVASDVPDPPVQVMAELSEYDLAVLSIDSHVDVPSEVSVENDA